MPGLRQGYTCVCREGACYLNTELALAGFQTDSYAEELDPAQACLRLLLSSLPQAKVGGERRAVPIQAYAFGPRLFLTLVQVPQTMQTNIALPTCEKAQ